MKPRHFGWSSRKPTGRQENYGPLAMMKQSLSLSDEQAKKLEPMLKEQQDKLNALRRDTSLSRKDRMVKLKELQNGADSKIRAHLTPEQAEKWQQLRQGFQRQGQGAGKTNVFSVSPQPGLPAWSTRSQQRQQPQPQPAQRPARK